MTTTVKICGIKTADALEVALGAGADFVGFVFYPPSPRNIAPETAAELAKQVRGRAKIVALMVDPDDNLVEFVVRTIKPDLLQLHGAESPERCRELRERFALPVMKAIKVETADDVEATLAYNGAVELILFDAKAPKDLAGALPGGNGLAFDWRILQAVESRVEFMLSGGLTPDNVAAAIRATGARAVDVSTGVESAPGIKDATLIVKFLAAAKSA